MPDDEVLGVGCPFRCGVAVLQHQLQVRVTSGHLHTKVDVVPEVARKGCVINHCVGSILEQKGHRYTLLCDQPLCRIRQTPPPPSRDDYIIIMISIN